MFSTYQNPYSIKTNTQWLDEREKFLSKIHNQRIAPHASFTSSLFAFCVVFASISNIVVNFWRCKNFYKSLFSSSCRSNWCIDGCDLCFCSAHTHITINGGGKAESTIHTANWNELAETAALRLRLQHAFFGFVGAIKLRAQRETYCLCNFHLFLKRTHYYSYCVDCATSFGERSTVYCSLCCVSLLSNGDCGAHNYSSLRSFNKTNKRTFSDAIRATSSFVRFETAPIRPGSSPLWSQFVHKFIPDRVHRKHLCSPKIFILS